MRQPRAHMSMASVPCTPRRISGALKVGDKRQTEELLQRDKDDNI